MSDANDAFAAGMSCRPACARQLVVHQVDADLIEAIEDELCVSHNAWDLVDPIELVTAVLKVCKS